MPMRAGGYNRHVRTWLFGAATFWPLVYTGFFGAVVAAAVASGRLLVPQPVLLGLQVATTILIVALLVAYLRDAYGNPRLTAARRRFWTVVLFVGSTVAMPVYWWLYVRPTGRMLAPAEPPGH
jgi:hypothetical protein